MKESILVVDDNDDIRNLIVLTLTSQDYEVYGAKGGDEALELIEAKKPSLILLDVMMPGKSGLDVLKIIRSSKSKEIYSSLVMMISAKSQISDIDLAIESGADDYIVKPFRAQHLIEKVEHIFISDKD